MNPLIQSWLLQAAFLFLLLGSVAGMLVGALLLFYRDRLQRISDCLNRWVSTRHLDRQLERRITLDPWIYRHRRLSGAALAGGALFILYYFSVALDRADIVRGLAQRLAYPQALAEAMLDALVLSAFIGGVCALLAALFILFRPSTLRGFETQANQWLSLRQALKPLEVPRDTMEIYVERHARQIGIFLLAGGLYTLLMLLVWADSWA